ncbi:MAG TPA: hypothetical protein VH950_08125 [Gaiellaceae bacterium]|jgi:hypothetical protein
MTAARLVRSWARLYTRGLDPDVRASRAAELDSDLWEQLSAEGDSLRTQLAIVSRLLRGAADDLSWRRERTRPRRRPTPAGAARALGWSVWATALLFLLVTHAWAASPLVGIELYGEDWDNGVWVYAGISSALLVLLAGGLGLLWPRPRLGASLVAASALGTAVAFPWALAAYGPAALAITAGTIVLARRRYRASSATS